MSIIYLLLAHFIADSSLQPGWMLYEKKNNWYIMLEHSFIWAGVISLVLNYLGLFAMWEFFYLLVTHFAIDEFKAHSAKDILDKNYLYIDQALHFLTIGVCYVW